MLFIEICGCDDTTRCFMDVDDKGKEVLRQLAIQADLNSTYGCQPTINIYECTDEDYNKYLRYKELDKKCDKLSFEESQEYYDLNTYSLYNFDTHCTKIYEYGDLKF